MNIKVLRISSTIIAIALFVLAIMMFVLEKSFAGLWFLPLAIVLLLLVWVPWYNARKKNAGK